MKSTSPALRTLSVIVLCLGVCVLALPSPGVGAPARDSASRKLEAIRQLMEKGQGLYLAGNYAAAAEVFEEGYTRYPYSALLFNAGVSYQKLNDTQRALEKFRDYVRVDPAAPDIEKVKQRISALEGQQQTPAPADTTPGAAGAGGEAPVSQPVTPPPPAPDDEVAMRSLVVVETEPSDAPLRFYARTDPNAAAFRLGAQNAGWREIATARSPVNLTLSVGKYHVVVEKFRDFNESHADIDVSPGHVYQFKANLSQGEFMAFLRVSANVKGAYVWLDDKKKERPFWGTTPHGELVPAGTHEVLVEAPGFEPLLAPVTVKHGEQKEMEVELVRVGYGFLRIDSNAPEVRVRIDEQPKGVWKSGTEPLDVRAPSGPHKLTVLSDGRKTFEGMVDVPRGQVLPVHVKMIPKYPRGAAWTQAIIGAAFIGAGAYFGSESNEIHEQLEADRASGRLEENDSRATQGRWYAIGANGGFAIGGVLGILATYNFIKDPLPESSIKTDKPAEFEDPMQRRPTARLLTPRARVNVAARREQAPRGLVPELGVAPAAPGTPGLFLGGKF